MTDKLKCSFVICRVTKIPQDGFVIDIESQRKGLCAGTRLDVYFPGFPTLKHLKHKVQFACICTY